jgi:hypothetical protein
MYYLHELFDESPLLLKAASVLSLAFTIWMLVDAYRRGVEFYWYYFIFFIQPIGGIVYFFIFKVRDFRSLQGIPFLNTGPSLAELRRRAERIPTLASHLEYAQRLTERNEFDEALPHLLAAHKMEPDHWQVVYLLALCHVRQDHLDEALPLLERLTAREPRWSGYIAWRLLMEAREKKGDANGVLAAGRELVRYAPTLQNSCELAERLFAAGHDAEARSVLDRALGDHDFATFGARWRERKWATQARALLDESERTGDTEEHGGTD